MARLLAGTFILAGSAGTSLAETRALSLFNTHTQERANVVFKRDGSYDPQGLQELNRLLRDWRRNESTRMDPVLFDLVWEVYRRVGSHQPIHIVSGYRSPATNNALRSRSRGVAKLSQHMLGKAMDFYLPDVPLSTLRETGMKLQMGGVGFYPTSGSPFVHMDTGSVRAWPRMTREQLVRLFPDGKTAHLPADGDALPGYETALAEVQSRKERGGGPVERSSSGGGLLAALFGGGWSSSSSTAAAPGDDEEEGAAPAPRRPARQQELRQGPLPPGSDPKILARRGGETPPGVDDEGTVRAAPTRPTQVAAAPAPAPTEAVPLPPQRPVPTAVAGGSIVPLPVVQPGAAPVRPGATTVASAEPLPSRYAPPAGNGLPPGWVQGPSGRPVAEEKPQPITFSAGLTPMDAPMPRARPDRAVPAEMVAMAVVGTPAGSVALPRPRPGGAMRSADAGSPADAHAALAAFTGDGAPEVPALGYATAALPTPGPTDAVFAAAAPQRAAPEGRFSAAALAAAPRGKTDRIAAAARPTGKGDRGAFDRIFDAGAHPEDESFAALRHPDQNALDPLFVKPRMSLAAGFTTASLDADMARRGFAGPAVVSLPVILTK